MLYRTETANKTTNCLQVWKVRRGHVTDVSVDLYDLLDAVGLHQGRGDSLLHSETHSFRRLNADGCRAQLQNVFTSIKGASEQEEITDGRLFVFLM